MISPMMIKIMQCLPKKIIHKISNKLLNKYINKYAKIEVKGIENLKNIKKPIIFVCNHLSNSDALILNKVLKNQELTFVAGIKLASTPLTKLGLELTNTIFIKPNTADKEAISNIIKTIRKGNNVLIFPEGTRSRTASMIEGKKGVVLMQRLGKATMVPIGIWGTEKLLPINDNDMGAEKFQHAEVKLNIGKAINFPDKESNEGKHEYEEKMLNIIMKSIAKLLPESYRGIYK
ncbi:bifunctional protein Aas [Clostridium acetireducens DSM 10703]|jgi:1-acyl-sn-glycerol-3-phosphate acyltransferase|uniref:Bifunctional protein Aas n=1 Tax=Clostridium acetireducens DSM 10703 TaxID=1121290 RepID=A0A1E8EX34_9CLOT|nr:lysophospholipid acyltransferase family protein [Clostridium acetireducens]OFI05076.1 bifunctional protein Aas [Clostridium acetireducens DSM 10703]